MKQSVAIGIDLGGTNLKCAAVDDGGRILASNSLAIAGRQPDVVIEEIARLVGQLLSEASLAHSEMVGVGIGTPGPLSRSTGRIVRAANLPGWVDVPLKDLLHERLDTRVALDNDGNAAAFGEFWIGAGQGSGDLVMLTLGTGVGGGVVLDGHILHGEFGNAAELGHMIVAVDGLPCSCGQQGCLEQYASAAAVGRRVVAAIEGGAGSKLAEAVGEGQVIDAKRVVQCALAGDSLCLRIWDEACLYLAIACINIQHAFNPGRIVLGGGMSNAGAFLLDRVTDHVARRRWKLHDDLPTICLAKLGYNAGVIGAAGMAWHDTT